MDRVRTFVGIDPGQKIRDRCVALQKNFARAGVAAKWVEPENLHLTLLFLGEVDLTTVPTLCELVQQQACQHTSFTLTIEGPGCFPTPRRPRVLWVGVGQGQQEVVALHDALEEPLLELGCYRREERQYTPHLTLGRLQGDRQSLSLEPLLHRYSDWVGGETTIREVYIMASELTPEGPIYSVLSRARLK